MAWSTSTICVLALALTSGLQVNAMRERRINHVSNICSMWGNFHFKTFDGDVYQYKGTCEYNLVSDCNGPVQGFSVHVKRAGIPGISQITRVLVTIGDLVIELTKKLVMVNSDIVKLPHYVAGVMLEENSIYIKLYAKIGLSVTWNKDDTVTLELDTKYSNRTCGLCGDYNGAPVVNEFLSDGRVTGFIEFGNKHRIFSPNDVCEDPYEEFENEANTVENCQSYREDCSELLLDESWSLCRNLLSPEPYIQACMIDMCASRPGDTDDTAPLCSTLTEYSRQCSHAGGKPPNWRTPTFCAVTCPFNMEYSESGSPCQDTCTHTHTSSLCQEHKTDGCFCPPGTVFDDISERGCIPQEQCQCKHNKVYNTGEVLLKDDEECVCQQGRWICKSLSLPGVCAVGEGSHFTTFDGKEFSFHGNCYYVLSKECVDSKFTILGQLIPCVAQHKDTCLKSIALLLNNDKSNALLIKDDGVIRHNGDIRLPYTTAEFTVFRPSSFYIMLQTTFGLNIHVQLVPVMQLYITLDKSFQSKTCGLCGNFNMVLSDELMTPQGVVEGTATSFANSWKAQSNCPDQKERFDDPCSYSIDSESYAEHWCSKLKGKEDIFAKCHSTVNPESYYKRCKYSSCMCEKSEDCLCAVFSSYVWACAAKGVFLQRWRDTVCEKYTKSCPASQSFSYNVQQCQRTCDSLSWERQGCRTDYVPVDGCACPAGLYESMNGVCVPMDKCPCYHSGEHIKPGKSINIKNDHCICTNGKLQCQSWKPRITGCPAPKVFFNCSTAGPDEHGLECAQTCTQKNADCYLADCESGCKCPAGLLDDGHGNCVNEHECPCKHDNHFYAPGSQIMEECNKCICKRGEWDCTKYKCPGTCTIYGSGHYNTFDKQRFGFSGFCSYIAVQNNCGNKTRTFNVITENMPCGTSGTSCSKAVRIILGRTELELRDGKMTEIKAETGLSIKFNVRYVGLYLVIDSEIGITVMWDFKTTVRIILQPHHMGEVCGLCGNFNGNGKDDFTTQDSLHVSDVLEFVNSWKLDDCPEATLDFDPCFHAQNRHTWAKLQCSIIKSDTFKECHNKVEWMPYFDNCVKDSCSCDTGGDCECFCTAVAAYAQACNEAGVCVAWRTPQICPVFCDYYNHLNECIWHYSPCETPCYKTCLNPSGNCTNPLPNLEGCYPKCPPEKPIFDEKNQICVKECLGCFINGTEYTPGEKIPTKIPCNICYCHENGSEICSLKPGCCFYNGKEYNDTDVIYNVTDNMGTCYYAICINNTVSNSSYPCQVGTTQPPTTETSAVTTTTPEPKPTTTPVVTTESTTSQETTTSVSTTTGSTTTPCIICDWTDWINIYNPSNGGDDLETYENIKNNGTKICEKPEIIQCRSAQKPDVSLEDIIIGTGQVVECNVSFGLVCEKRKQTARPYKCLDYEIKVFCCRECDSTTTTTPVITTTSQHTITTTESPVPSTTTKGSTTLKTGPTSTTEKTTKPTMTPVVPTKSTTSQQTETTPPPTVSSITPETETTSTTGKTTTPTMTPVVPTESTTSQQTETTTQFIFSTTTPEGSTTLKTELTSSSGTTTKPTTTTVVTTTTTPVPSTETEGSTTLKTGPTSTTEKTTKPTMTPVVPTETTTSQQTKTTPPPTVSSTTPEAEPTSTTGKTTKPTMTPVVPTESTTSQQTETTTQFIFSTTTPEGSTTLKTELTSSSGTTTKPTTTTVVTTTTTPVPSTETEGSTTLKTGPTSTTEKTTKSTMTPVVPTKSTTSQQTETTPPPMVSSTTPKTEPTPTTEKTTKPTATTVVTTTSHQTVTTTELTKETDLTVVTGATTKQTQPTGSQVILTTTPETEPTSTTGKTTKLTTTPVTTTESTTSQQTETTTPFIFSTTTPEGSTTLNTEPTSSSGTTTKTTTTTVVTTTTTPVPSTSTEGSTTIKTVTTESTTSQETATSVSTTTGSTTISETTPCIICDWTDWINIYNPSNGGDDLETYENIKNNGTKICEKPEIIQCRSAQKPDVSLEDIIIGTGQVVECNVSFGLVCEKRKQTERPYKCLDYEIKVFCCRECDSTTTTTPVITTTSQHTITTTESPVPSTTTKGSTTLKTGPTSTTEKTTKPTMTPVVPTETTTSQQTKTTPPPTVSSTTPEAEPTSTTGKTTKPTMTPVVPTESTTSQQTGTTTPFIFSTTTPEGSTTLKTEPTSSSGTTTKPTTTTVVTTTTTPVPSTETEGSTTLKTGPTSTTEKTTKPTMTPVVPTETTTSQQTKTTPPPTVSSTTPEAEPTSTTGKTTKPTMTPVVPTESTTSQQTETTTQFIFSTTTPEGSTTLKTELTSSSGTTTKPTTTTVVTTTTTPVPSTETEGSTTLKTGPTSTTEKTTKSTMTPVVPTKSTTSQQTETTPPPMVSSTTPKTEPTPTTEKTTKPTATTVVTTTSHQTVTTTELTKETDLTVVTGATTKQTQPTGSQVILTTTPETEPTSTTGKTTKLTTTPVTTTESTTSQQTETTTPFIFSTTTPEGSTTLNTEPTSSSGTTTKTTTTTVVTTTTTPVPSTSTEGSTTIKTVTTESTTSQETATSVSTTTGSTTISETTPCIICDWTDWINIYNPSNGGDDLETYENIKNNGTKICEKPEIIQCRSAQKPDVSLEDIIIGTGQVVECNVSFGLVCEKRKQTARPYKCLDYEIKVFCCRECDSTTTTTPVITTTSQHTITTTESPVPSTTTKGSTTLKTGPTSTTEKTTKPTMTPVVPTETTTSQQTKTTPPPMVSSTTPEAEPTSTTGKTTKPTMTPVVPTESTTSQQTGTTTPFIFSTTTPEGSTTLKTEPTSSSGTTTKPTTTTVVTTTTTPVPSTETEGSTTLKTGPTSTTEKTTKPTMTPVVPTETTTSLQTKTTPPPTVSSTTPEAEPTSTTGKTTKPTMTPVVPTESTTSQQTETTTPFIFSTTTPEGSTTLKTEPTSSSGTTTKPTTTTVVTTTTTPVPSTETEGSTTLKTGPTSTTEKTTKPTMTPVVPTETTTSLQTKTTPPPTVSSTTPEAEPTSTTGKTTKPTMTPVVPTESTTSQQTETTTPFIFSTTTPEGSTTLKTEPTSSSGTTTKPTTTTVVTTTTTPVPSTETEGSTTLKTGPTSTTEKTTKPTMTPVVPTETTTSQQTKTTPPPTVSSTTPEAEPTSTTGKTTKPTMTPVVPTESTTSQQTETTTPFIFSTTTPEGSTTLKTEPTSSSGTTTKPTTTTVVTTTTTPVPSTETEGSTTLKTGPTSTTEKTTKPTMTPVVPTETTTSQQTKTTPPPTVSSTTPEAEPTSTTGKPTKPTTTTVVTTSHQTVSTTTELTKETAVIGPTTKQTQPTGPQVIVTTTSETEPTSTTGKYTKPTNTPLTTTESTSQQTVTTPYPVPTTTAESSTTPETELTSTTGRTTKPTMTPVVPTTSHQTETTPPFIVSTTTPEGSTTLKTEPTSSSGTTTKPTTTIVVITTTTPVPSTTTEGSTTLKTEPTSTTEKTAKPTMTPVVPTKSTTSQQTETATTPMVSTPETEPTATTKTQTTTTTEKTTKPTTTPVTTTESTSQQTVTITPHPVPTTTAESSITSETEPTSTTGKTTKPTTTPVVTIQSTTSQQTVTTTTFVSSTKSERSTPETQTTTTGKTTKPTTTPVASTTECFCIINGKHYKPGEPILEDKDIGSSVCLTMICSDSCVIYNTTRPCPPTPTPTPTLPTEKNCTDWGVKENITFEICNCTMARCIENNIIEIIPYECPPLQNITCSNRKPPVLVPDENYCCEQRACDCFCEGWGDPHYKTFDGRFYSHQGECTYVLMQEISPKHHLKIYIDNVNCDPRESVSCPRSIIVSYNNLVVTLKNHNLIGAAKLEALLGKSTMKLPFQQNGLRVLSSVLNLILEIPKLNVVVMFGVTGFSVNLPFQYFGNNTQGHCGTCNNNMDDDCMLPGGTFVDNCAAMANYWQAKDLNNPECKPPPVEPETAAPTKTPCPINTVCELLKSDLFKECHRLVSPENYFAGCQFDSCHTSNPAVVCTSVQTYASHCSQAGICINWRDHTNLCTAECPADKVYQPCGPADPPTCKDKPEDHFLNMTTEGCFCPDGMKLFSKESGVCVDKCGCLDPSGQGREFGEEFQYGCQDCVCDEGSVSIICKPKQCSNNSNQLTCSDPGFIVVNVTDPLDACCTIHTCSCESSTCPSVNAKCPIGYTPVFKVPEGKCCPEYTCEPKSVCVHKRQEYEPGTSIPVIDCQECHCTWDVDPNTQLYKVQCGMVTCNEKCEPGYSYVESDTDECCGKCVKRKCVLNYNGTVQILENGAEWTPSNDACDKFICTLTDGEYVTTNYKIQCPPFNISNCQPGTVQLSANRCCQVCVDMDSGCKVQTTFDYITHNSCRSKTRVEQTHCQGHCNSYSKYTELGASSCSCCQASRTSKRQVSLDCLNGEIINHTYFHVEACSCDQTKCLGKFQSVHTDTEDPRRRRSFRLP
ncbi:mucin-2 isoform X1 [Hemibagrus wyckioides]|uniref:mucin-2 isoform X1 n=1 Tax=Hemibagrus wyckioides TaxID=337641 RepID=UPI00266DC6EA|nr:mucin-2 isoform X1 [Hemibagrus wyckioides]